MNSQRNLLYFDFLQSVYFIKGIYCSYLLVRAKVKGKLDTDDQEEWIIEGIDTTFNSRVYRFILHLQPLFLILFKQRHNNNDFPWGSQNRLQQIRSTLKIESRFSKNSSKRKFNFVDLTEEDETESSPIRNRALSWWENNFEYQERRILIFKKLLSGYPETRARLIKVCLFVCFVLLNNLGGS